MLEVTVYTAKLDAALAKLGPSLDTEPEIIATKRRIGMLALEDVRRDFVERQKPTSNFWPTLSAVTVVLRKQGRGGRIYSEEDLWIRQAQTPKLRDSGLLLASLTPGGPGNICRDMPWAVMVGTTHPGASVHQNGGQSTFEFDAEKREAFDQNVSKVAKGRQVPDPLPKGHRYKWNSSRGQMRIIKGQRRAKKAIEEAGGWKGGWEEAADYFFRGIWWHCMPQPSPWNTMYFIMLNYMKKISGTSRRVPKREIVSTPNEARLIKYAKQLDRGIKALATRLGL